MIEGLKYKTLKEYEINIKKAEDKIKDWEFPLGIILISIGIVGVIISFLALSLLIILTPIFFLGGGYLLIDEINKKTDLDELKMEKKALPIAKTIEKEYPNAEFIRVLCYYDDSKYLEISVHEKKIIYNREEIVKTKTIEYELGHEDWEFLSEY